MAFTFFFRDQHVLDLVIRVLTPHLIGRNHPRIWDAGCAMGQEPYSLAILFAETLGTFAFRNLQIIATDIDEQDSFGPMVTAGEYPEDLLARIPGDLLERYFEPGGRPGHRRVCERVRSRIRFQKHDLRSLQPVGTGFSLILCKNVLLHLHPRQRTEVMAMFHAALAPGGFLAVEQTQGLPNELAHRFERVVEDGQIFRRLELARGTPPEVCGALSAAVTRAAGSATR
jgi:chemotaxis protein methyltransferase CheR